MADATYQPKVYKKDGGDTLVVDPGGVIDFGGPVAAGSTLSVTKALHARRIVALDTAAGSTCTLPAATGTGAVYTFIVTVTPTSNQHTVAALTTDIMAGQAFGVDGDGEPGNAWGTAGDTDKILMNSGTQGGEIGDRVVCVDIKTGVWAVTAHLTQSGSEATPFANT